VAAGFPRGAGVGGPAGDRDEPFRSRYEKYSSLHEAAERVNGALILAKAYSCRKYFISYHNIFHGVGVRATSVSGIGLASEVRKKIGK